MLREDPGPSRPQDKHANRGFKSRAAHGSLVRGSRTARHLPERQAVAEDTPMPPHPHGVQPEGNLWLLAPQAAAAAHAKRSTGLGNLARLDDPTLLTVCSFSGAAALAALCCASDTLSAYASCEELWQSLCLRRAVKSSKEFSDAPSEPFAGFCGSWKASCLAAMRTTSARGGSPPTLRAHTRGVSVFSDTLYRPHELTYGASAFGKKPAGPLCARLTAAEVAPDAEGFAAAWEVGAGRPVVIESAGAVAVASGVWEEGALLGGLGERVFHAGGVNFRLGDYFDYARSNTDDQPLYLFDPTFNRSAPELLGAYDVPPQFSDDLFSLLEGSGPRPDYRWLLIGGPRSGQSWHQDPNGTSAWNLTLTGRKRWLFFPPSATPPGVVKSADGDVTPISLEEWARQFYEEACSTPGCLEAETVAGEVMFVPRGWWHMVRNVAPLTVAVSHHFLSPTGLHNTIRLLRESPEEVSGIDRGLRPRQDPGPNPPPAAIAMAAADDHERRSAAGTALLDRLVAALRERRPEALARAEEDLSRRPRALLPPAASLPFAFNFLES